jgi:hypothetical protein
MGARWRARRPLAHNRPRTDIALNPARRTKKIPDRPRPTSPHVSGQRAPGDPRARRGALRRGQRPDRGAAPSGHCWPRARQEGRVGVISLSPHRSSLPPRRPPNGRSPQNLLTAACGNERLRADRSCAWMTASPNVRHRTTHQGDRLSGGRRTQLRIHPTTLLACVQAETLP